MRRTIAVLAAALLACAVAAAGAGAASRSGGAQALRHASSATTTVSGLDKMSLQTSMAGDLFEIAGGKLALAKSHTRAVDALAKRLIKDHTKSYKDAAKVAKEVGVKVETKPTPTETWQLLTVAKVGGKTFDTWYTSLEVYDHVQDIQDTAEEIKDGTNAAVVSDAKQDLPMLKMHLKLAKAALKAVK
jgi:putative membrane protein